MLAPYRRDGDEERTRAFIAHRPLHLEIGFGRPHYLLDLAAMMPQAHVLGFEIKRQWVHAAAERGARLGLGNVRAIEGDARPHIERLVPERSVDGIHVLFPDPWWKKRHHKRRVFNAEFVALLVSRLADDGMLVAKTDVEAYAEQLQDELAQAGMRLAGAGTAVGSPAAPGLLASADPTLAALPRSHREKKCLELGIPVFLYRFEVRLPRAPLPALAPETPSS